MRQAKYYIIGQFKDNYFDKLWYASIGMFLNCDLVCLERIRTYSFQ